MKTIKLAVKLKLPPLLLTPRHLTNDFTYMPFIFVEEVVKSLSEIEFEESKMNCSSPLPTNLLQTIAEQQGEDPLQLEVVEQPPVQERPILGLDISALHFIL